MQPTNPIEQTLLSNSIIDSPQKKEVEPSAEQRKQAKDIIDNF